MKKWIVISVVVGFLANLLCMLIVMGSMRRPSVPGWGAVVIYIAYAPTWLIGVDKSQWFAGEHALWYIVWNVSIWTVVSLAVRKFCTKSDGVKS